MPVYIALLTMFISLVVVLVGVLYLTVYYRRILICVCSVFVAIGFVFYSAAYLGGSTDIGSIVYAAFRGILSTVRMLFMADDFWMIRSIEGVEWLTENLGLLLIFWFCHVAALVILQTAIVAVFGRKFVGNLRLRLGRHEEIYIIKGCDKRALRLGESIARSGSESGKNGDGEQSENKRRPRKSKNSDKRKLVVFMIDEEDDDSKVTRLAWRFGAVAQVAGRKKDFLSCLVTSGLRKGDRCKKKYHIIIMPNDEQATKTIRDTIKYANGEKIKQENLEIFVFVSSECDRAEIEKIKRLNFSDISSAQESEAKCLYTIHILSEVDLAVRQMIKKKSPYKCPKLRFSDDAVAEKQFTIMLVGFGEIGQAAFLHLLMNGVFLNPQGNRMRAIVVDGIASTLKCNFAKSHPGLDLCCDISYNNVNALDDKFYEILDENLANIDYIVVALNNDVLNKNTAYMIEQHYISKEIDSVNHPFIAVSQKWGMSESSVGNVFYFGKREDFYEESTIIRDKDNEMAQAVHEVYDKETSWNHLDWFSQESNRASAAFIPAMLHLAKVDEETVLSLEVGARITDDENTAENLAITESLRWTAFHVAMGWKAMSVHDMGKRFDYARENDISNPLNYCRKDVRTRSHVCLVSWEGLDEVTAEYRKLAELANDENEMKRDFKDINRKITYNIPQFINKANDMQN